VSVSIIPGGEGGKRVKQSFRRGGVEEAGRQSILPGESFQVEEGLRQGLNEKGFFFNGLVFCSVLF